MRNELKIGVIGCGTIGSEIAKAIDNGIVKAKLVAVHDKAIKQLSDLVNTLKTKPMATTTIDELINLSDLVVESAHKSVVKEIAVKTVNAGKDLLVMSVGGILDCPEILGQAEQKGTKIYLPSGAIAGLDSLKASMIGKVSSVTLTTRKPPQGLAGAPYLTENKIDVTTIKTETVVFDGTASEAVKGFPANINVAAILSLTGLGADKTKVKIVADPAIKRNIHEVTIEGDCGRIVTRTENLPSPTNPKTSYLAILSAIATLQQITRNVKLGT